MMLNLEAIRNSVIQEYPCSTYRASIAQLTGLNLEQQFIRISLGRLDPIVNGPHSDWEGIILTHLLYFGREDWKNEWGGCLKILLNEQLESLFQEIPPRNGNSVVLVRSQNSWHNVSPVSRQASQDRLTLMVRFYDRITFLQNYKC